MDHINESVWCRGRAQPVNCHLSSTNESGTVRELSAIAVREPERRALIFLTGKVVGEGKMFEFKL